MDKRYDRTGAEPEAQTQSIDPTTGQPVGPTATLTFAEWCAVDPALLDADKAAFEQYYKPLADAQAAVAAEAAATAAEASGSAFARYYATGAEQKMDRGTLDARIASMTASLEANPPPVPPATEPA